VPSEVVAELEAVTRPQTSQSARAPRSAKGSRSGRAIADRGADQGFGDHPGASSVAIEWSPSSATVSSLPTHRNGEVNAAAVSLRRHLLLGVLRN
jgi:hypothetical protein